MKTPLLSLEEATKSLPVEDIDVHVLDALRLAKSKLKKGNSHNLTLDEVFVCINRE